MSSKEVLDEKLKSELIEKGLHLDWLYRAHRVSNMETLVYFSEQRQKWINEDQKQIMMILQDYNESGGGLIPAHTPAPFQRKHRKVTSEEVAHDPDELYIFTCQLIDLVKEERPIWDKLNCPQFGYHQPMRQSWCSVSLKLGGWGTMQHVQMLKQLYRRRRDQYNIDHLRHGKPFPYSEKLSFLKNLVEMTKSDSPSLDIKLEDHLNALSPKIDYEDEIQGAPPAVQDLLRCVSETIDEAISKFSPEEFSEYLSKCCNEVVDHREFLATEGLEWMPPYADSDNC